MQLIKYWGQWILLLVFFFFLAYSGREFAYLYLDLGIMPVFVSDLALICALVLVGFHGRHQLLRSSPIFLLFLGLYLVWGLIHLSLSLFFGVEAYGIVQILRDSALHYQALWVLLGLSLSRKEALWLLSVMLFSGGLGQLLRWVDFIELGLFSSRLIHGIGGISTNEVVSPLAPLSFAIWPLPAAAALTGLYSFDLAGQVLVYFKKNWFFSFFFLAMPVGLLSLLPGDIFKRFKAWALGLTVGFVAITISVLFVSNRTLKSENGPFLIADTSDLIAPIAKKIEDVKSSGYWLMHGELQRNERGEIVSVMSWRMHLWRQAYQGFLASALIGNGFGPRVVNTKPGGEASIQDGKWVSGPHNSFLTVAFRSGGVGLIFLFGMLSMAGTFFWKSGARSRLGNIYSACFVSTFFYAAFNVCLENPQSGIWFWLFLGCMVRFTSVTPIGNEVHGDRY